MLTFLLPLFYQLHLIVTNVELFFFPKKQARKIVFFFFFKFNVGVRVSLRAPRLIPRALKLTTM